MNKFFTLIYLVSLSTLSFSCIGNKSPGKEKHKTEFVHPSNSDTLKFTSGVRSILQDSKGNYWLGSHNEGVCLFDGKSFTYFTTHEGLPHNQVRSIQEDNNGTIWFGTANGVSSYDGKKITNYTTGIYHPDVALENTGSYLWFNAGEKSGINQFDGKNLHYLPFPKPHHNNPGNSYGVTDISKDKDGKVWIATYAALFNFDGKAINVVDRTQLALKEQENLHIRSVLADSKGRTWIGNNGIGVLLLQGNSIINFSRKNGLIHTNSSNNGNHSPAGTLEHVFAIEEDGAGNIWFGDRDTGAWKFDGKTLTNYPVDTKLSTPMIWCIYKDNNNNLLFGMANGGIYKFNGTSFTKMF